MVEHTGIALAPRSVLSRERRSRAIVKCVHALTGDAEVHKMNVSTAVSALLQTNIAQ